MSIGQTGQLVLGFVFTLVLSVGSAFYTSGLKLEQVETRLTNAEANVTMLIHESKAHDVLDKKISLIDGRVTRNEMDINKTALILDRFDSELNAVSTNSTLTNGAIKDLTVVVKELSANTKELTAVVKDVAVLNEKVRNLEQKSKR